MDSELARCVAFIRGMASRQAETSVRTEHGFIHLSPTLPLVWYLNFLAVDLGAQATADELAAEAEAIQDSGDFRHRKVSVDDDLGALLKEFRGRGFGKAVVARALAESMAAAHDLTFLLADAEDWPKELYRKLGFEEVGRVWDFIREPSRAP
jgi:GNAT superfamily N-acetyltransferase